MAAPATRPPAARLKVHRPVSGDWGHKSPRRDSGREAPPLRGVFFVCRSGVGDPRLRCSGREGTGEDGGPESRDSQRAWRRSGRSGEEGEGGGWKSKRKLRFEKTKVREIERRSRARDSPPQTRRPDRPQRSGIARHPIRWRHQRPARRGILPRPPRVPFETRPLTLTPTLTRPSRSQAPAPSRIQPRP